MDITSPRGTN